MPYVITAPCSGSKDTGCVDACPVDAIHPTAFDSDFDDYDQLFIDPDLCIECGACVPVCPTDAIFMHSSVPEQVQEYIELNRLHYQPDSPSGWVV